jgi:hypothetical protein
LTGVVRSLAFMLVVVVMLRRMLSREFMPSLGMRLKIGFDLRLRSSRLVIKIVMMTVVANAHCALSANWT